MIVVPTANADLYDPADWAPSVWSDKADYAPGERVTLNGAHWQPDETVHIRVNDDTGASWDRDVDVTADEAGGIVDEFDLPNWFVAKYRVTATGASGAVATHTFTDSNYYVKNASNTPAGVAVSYKIETFSSEDCSGTGSVKFDGMLTGPNAASAQAIDQDAGSVRFTYVGANGGYGFDKWQLDNHPPGRGGATDGAPVTGGRSATICDSAKNGGTVTYVSFSKQAKQDQTITFNALDDRTYGDADFQLNATASSNLEVSYSASGSCSVDADKVRITAAGSCTITASQLGNANFNTATAVDRSFTILRRAITVTADAKSKVYGTADPALTAQVTGGSLLNGDSLSGDLSRDAGENVGEHAINQGGLTAGNNYDLTFVGAKLTINPRAITVTADAQTKVYGNPDPELTYKLSEPLVGNDEFSGMLARDEGENVGSYDIKLGGLDAGGNYVLNFEGAKLAITPRPITAIADAQTKVYGNPDPALTYKLSEPLVGEDKLTGALVRDAGENVGSYDINRGDLAASGNYVLKFEGAKLAITRRAITVTADDKSKVLGAADPVLTYKVTAGELVGQDKLSGELTRELGETVEGNPYAIKEGTLTASGNYQLTFVKGTFTILYDWDGFLQPINDTAHQTGPESKFKLGQTVPAKFVIKNASGAVVTQASNPTFSRSGNLGPCDPNTVAENVTEDPNPSAGGTYNWDGSKYHYNWNTKGLTAGAGEYRIYANLADGTKRYVDICLTK
jgi:MBG domain (YGX type)